MLKVYDILAVHIKQYYETAKSSKLTEGFISTLFGSGISKVILTIATFLIANELSKMEFGEFSFIRNTLNTILCICALNFVSLCTKFTVEAENSNKSFQRLFILFLFSIGICIIVGVALAFMPSKILVLITGTESLIYFFRLIGLLLPLFILQPLMEGVLRGIMKFKLIGILQTLTAVLFVILVYSGLKISGLSGAVVGILLYYAIYSVLSIIVTCYFKPFSHIRQRLYGFGKEFSVIHRMILPIFLMSFVEAPTLWISQLLLLKYDSMEVVGSMTAIFQLRNMMMLIPSYLFSTLVVFAGKMNAEKQYPAYFSKFNKLLKVLFIVGGGMAFLCSIFAQTILGLYGESYKADWGPFIISNLEIPILLFVGLLKIDLVIQEHQHQLLFSSLAWNGVWIIGLYCFLQLNISPLISFFVTQFLAVFIYAVWIYIVYNKDKKRLLYES